jgi:hypothetical protein
MGSTFIKVHSVKVNGQLHGSGGLYSREDFLVHIGQTKLNGVDVVVRINILTLDRNPNQLLLPTHEDNFDLGNGGAGGRRTVECLRPVTNVLQLMIHWTEVQLCLVGAS